MISGADINQCACILLTTFYHTHHYTMGIWSSVHIHYYNWGEPERAPHKRFFNVRCLYIYVYIMVRRSREIISLAWLYGHKREILYCAFSCLTWTYGPYMCHSNLANCKSPSIDTWSMIMNEPRPRVSQRKVRLQRRAELVVHPSPARGAAKKAIKIAHWDCSYHRWLSTKLPGSSGINGTRSTLLGVCNAHNSSANISFQIWHHRISLICNH